MKKKLMMIINPAAGRGAYKINLPDHLTPDVKSILGTAEEIEAINEGKCGFKCSTYQDKNGKTRNSGSFVDI